MASAGTFTRLCRELTARVKPALTAVGFRPPSPDFGRNEVRYDFKREANGEWQVLSVLFDKYRRPAFSVQIFVEPGSGLDSLVATGGVLTIGYVRSAYRPWPLAPASFRADRPSWQRLLGIRGSRETEAVDRFLALLPEIDRWWAAKASSRHILSSTLVYPGVTDVHSA